MSIPKFTDAEGARLLVGRGADEFAVVANPSYVYPPFEIYPLAEKKFTLDDGLSGAVMDMDGTTTTTEALCLHSLATMVQRITGRADDPDWRGLDVARDYPHIIGNSTTKHVEYLVRTYGPEIDRRAFCRHYLHAAAWTLSHAADEGRRNEVSTNLAALGLHDVVRDSRFIRLRDQANLVSREATEAIESLAGEAAQRMQLEDLTSQVRAAVDVYYQRYHEILGRLAKGEGAGLSVALFGEAGKHLIEPMPGIGVFLALIKGWLGDEAGFAAPALRAHLDSIGIECGSPADDAQTLEALGRHFEQTPARAAVVTSSIWYEADIVLREVFRVLRSEVQAWPLSERRRNIVLDHFSEYTRYYDGVVTASDSSEIRLKPHRDLYSIALHKMGVPMDQFHRVVGFEDSESGTIAIRAAGIPLCCAVPFPETHGHTFTAACHVAYGGIPEVILKHCVFLA